MLEYNGSRIAFSLFGIDVYWYGLLIVTGMVLAVLLSANEFKRKGEDPDIVYDVALWVLPSAIIGARIWYVIFEFDRYNSIGDILNFRDGGLAIHGGLIGALIAGYIFSRVKNLNMLKFTDVAFIFVPLAQSIGRWGNFINNEAYGRPTDLPWGLVIDGQTYHPTFLYESLGNFVLFLFLWYIYRKKDPNTGVTTSLYLIFYGIIRFFVEGLRTDSLYWGPFRVAQLVSIAGIIIGLIILWAARKGKFESDALKSRKSR